MKWLKLTIALAVVLATLGALIWGADLNSGRTAEARSRTPTVGLGELLAQDSGLSAQTVRRVQSAMLGVAADRAAQAGQLTQDQAGALRQLAFTPVLDTIFHGVAGSAGASDADLFSGLTQGRSLAQVAEAHGVSREALKARFRSALGDVLTGQQATGLLDANQAAVVQGLIATNLDQIIDSTAAKP